MCGATQTADPRKEIDNFVIACSVIYEAAPEEDNSKKQPAAVRPAAINIPVKNFHG